MQDIAGCSCVQVQPVFGWQNILVEGTGIMNEAEETGIFRNSVTSAKRIVAEKTMGTGEIAE